MTLPPASAQAFSDSTNIQPWPLQAFMACSCSSGHAVAFGLAAVAPRQCTLAGVAAAAGVAPARASETAAMASAAPERVLFFIGFPAS